MITYYDRYILPIGMRHIERVGVVRCATRTTILLFTKKSSSMDGHQVSNRVFWVSKDFKETKTLMIRW